jgi:2-keto-4-pentenoate hydratase
MDRLPLDASVRPPRDTALTGDGNELDPRVRAGLEAQLETWRAELARGAKRLGWKIGLNDPAIQERLGLRAPVIGFLTDHTLVAPGGRHSLAGAERGAAEAEIAIELRRDVEAGAEPDAALGAIESLGGAIELIDAAPSFDDLERVVSGNIFHQAVALGPTRQDVALSGVEVEVSVNGEQRARAPAAVDLAATIGLVADLLAAAGERLVAGDRIIAGALAPATPVEAGDTVSCDFGPLGTIGLTLDP